MTEQQIELPAGTLLTDNFEVTPAHTPTGVGIRPTLVMRFARPAGGEHPSVVLVGEDDDIDRFVADVKRAAQQAKASARAARRVQRAALATAPTVEQEG